MIKRKTIIIDRILQMRYAGVLIASMVLVIMLIISSTFWFMRMNSDMLNALPGSSDIIYGLVKYLLAVMVIYIIAVVIYSFFVSHKFAGPIYRFKCVLDDLAKGDLTIRAFLRDNDELRLGYLVLRVNFV